MNTALQEIGQPFPHEAEFIEHSQNLIRINTALEFNAQDTQEDFINEKTSDGSDVITVPVNQAEVAQ